MIWLEGEEILVIFSSAAQKAKGQQLSEKEAKNTARRAFQNNFELSSSVIGEELCTE